MALISLVVTLVRLKPPAGPGTQLTGQEESSAKHAQKDQPLLKNKSC